MGIHNIYLNGIILGISEIIGNLSIAPFADRVKRRQLNFVCSLSIIIIALLLLSLDIS